MSEILYRTAALSTTADDGRTITGIAVPFGDVATVGGVRERFMPGSIDTDKLPVLIYMHREPIGVVTEWTATKTGVTFTARISDTTQGREAATLVRDGALPACSVGFVPLETRLDSINGEPVVSIIRARVPEISLVAVPAYAGATITAIRHQEGNPMPTDTTPPAAATPDDLLEVRTGLTTLQRAVDTMAAQIAAGTAQHEAQHDLMQFRSFGDYVKATAAGNDLASRAFVGVTTAASIVRPQWLGMIEQDMQAKTPLTNLFTHTTDLPAEGLSLEFGKIDSNTVQVTQQVAQGDNIITGKIAYSAGQAGVVTLAGASEPISLQTIQRSSVPYLDDLFTAFGMGYALALETYVRGVFTAAATAREAAPTVTTAKTLANASVLDWIGLLLDLQDAVDATLYPLDGLIVSKSIFRTLMGLAETKTALQLVGAPDSKQGTVTLSTPITGKLGAFEISYLPGWDGDHVIGYSRRALKVREGAGAPLRLTPQPSAVNLTQQFAVYGFASAYVTDPAALHSVKFGA